MNIYVNINTNHAYDDTRIEEHAIHEFTTTGFCEGTYDATVRFACLPAAVDSNALDVILKCVMDFADIGEAIAFYGVLCRHLLNFLKKCHGYKKQIVVEQVGKPEISEYIDVEDGMTELELQARIMAILLEEQVKIGNDVVKIMNE